MPLFLGACFVPFVVRQVEIEERREKEEEEEEKKEEEEEKKEEEEKIVKANSVTPFPSSWWHERRIYRKSWPGHTDDCTRFVKSVTCSEEQR